ncbi:MAG TPA: 4Fe-4S binding protein [Kineosporiaceae bacterium]|nr:4Fe-4S binding protein [Kineosporiaceae bacterium]
MRWSRRAVQAAGVGLIGWQVVRSFLGQESATEGLCPFSGLETLWTLVTTGRYVRHAHPASVVLAVAVVVLAVTARGFFCGWLCAFGSLQEWVHAAAQALADRVPPLRRLRRALNRPQFARRWRRVDRVLRWGRSVVLAWALIGAVVTGTMVVRDADPWAALVSVAQFELSLGFTVLLATFALALFVERPFCRYACPLGAVLGLTARISPVAVQRDADTCLGCDLCNKACPAAIPVNTRTRVTDTACIGCLECVAACPSQPALSVAVALLPLTRS